MRVFCTDCQGTRKVYLWWPTSSWHSMHLLSGSSGDFKDSVCVSLAKSLLGLASKSTWQLRHFSTPCVCFEHQMCKVIVLWWDMAIDTFGAEAFLIGSMCGGFLTLICSIHFVALISIAVNSSRLVILLFLQQRASGMFVYGFTLITIENSRFVRGNLLVNK